MSESLYSKEVEDQNSSCNTDLEYEMPPCAKRYLTPQILQALHFKIVHNFSLPSLVFSTCILYVVYSEINRFSWKKAHGQCQSYLQLTRGDAEAERRRKLEEALTVTPKAECKRISQLLTHFSRQGHHDSHIRILHQGLISGQQHV